MLEEWIEQGQGQTSQWLFRDGSTTTTSPKEDISKEVDRCNGSLYMQIKHIVKSPIFVPDPAVANSSNSLANYSSKKYGTTHGRRRGVPKDTVANPNLIPS
jgi:hypothetical protein